MRRLSKFISLFAVAATALIHSGVVQAQTDFPVRPVKLVVPWPPGGLTDIISRQIAQKLSERWAQPVIVDNRAGANGIIGADLVAKAPADGYTLVTANPETHGLNHLLYLKVPYDALRDFEPVSLMVTQALVMVGAPSLQARTVTELVAYAKANPGKVRYSSWGRGSTSHLAMELLKSKAGIDMLHVPYKGAGPAFTDVMGGQVELMLSGIAPAVPQVRAGRVHALGITSAARSAVLPEVPTIAEQGFAGYDLSTWYGISAPKGTPPDVVSRISEGIRAALKDPAVVERMAALGVVIVGSTPDEFRRFNEMSLARWTEIAKNAGVQPE